MKKEKNQILRLQNIIEKDRMSCDGSFDELIVSDLNKLLSDYFDYKDSPVVEIVRTGDKFKVNVSVVVSRIRAFGIAK